MQAAPRDPMRLSFRAPAVLLAGCVVAPLGMLLAEQQIQVQSVLLATFLAVAARLLWCEGDIFDPTKLFPAAYLVWFAVGSYTFVHAYDPNLPLLDPVPLHFWALYILGFLGYWLAILLGGSTSSAQRQSAFTTSEFTSAWSASRFGVVFGALYFIGLLAYAHMTLREGIPVLSDGVSETRPLLSQRHGMALAIFMSAFWALLPMTFVKLWSAPVRSMRQRCLAYGFALFACGMLGSLGSRGQAVIPLIVVFVLRHYMVRPWRISRLALVGVVVYSTISVSGYARDLQLFGSMYEQKLSSYGIPTGLQPFAHGYLYVRAPITTFRDIAAIIPAKEPYQYGAIFLSPLTALLPGHHESSDLFFKRILGDEFVGFGEPASLLGSFYADFGIAGIFVGMFLTGLLAAHLYRRMQERHTLLAILYFCYFTQVLLLSLFGNIFPYLITIWLPALWWVADRWMRIREVPDPRRPSLPMVCADD